MKYTLFFILHICILPICMGNYALAEELYGIEEQIVKFELKHHDKLLTKITATNSVLTPFTSDGCSGGLSVGWQYLAVNISRIETIHGSLPPWESCCVTHDKVYHSGALQGDTSVMSFNRRKNADTLLKACVIKTGEARKEELLAEYTITNSELETIYKTIGELMYRAVRLGGMPCTGLPWRWGFGRPECVK